MPAPLTRRELDVHRCDNPRCNHQDHDILYLYSTCHPRAGLKAEYHRRAGSLVMRCGSCDDVVTVVQVSWGPDGGKS